MGCGGSKHAVDTANTTTTVKKSSSKKVAEPEAEKITDNVISETTVEPAKAEADNVAVEEKENKVVAVPEVATEKKELKEEIEIPAEKEESKDVIPVSVSEGIGSTEEAKKEEAVVASVAETEVSAKPVEEKVVAETQVSDKPVEEKVVAETQVAAKPVEETIVAETQVSDKPVEEKVVAETQVSDKPVEEKAPAVKEEIAVTESSSSTETPKTE